MIVPEKTVAAGLVLDVNVPSGLDWQAFSMACFPGSRRHNLKAIVAYGVYRRSCAAGQQRAKSAGAPVCGDGTRARGRRHARARRNDVGRHARSGIR
jgi:hypothetical protein